MLLTEDINILKQVPYTMESETSNHLYEIDFMTSVGDKICPIEVKSGNYRGKFGNLSNQH